MRGSPTSATRRFAISSGVTRTGRSVAGRWAQAPSSKGNQSQRAVVLGTMRKLVPLLAVVCPWIAGAAAAEEDRTGAPYFFVKDQRAAEALPLKETRAKVGIAG